VDFYQDKKLVGQAPVQLVDQGRKSVDTEVHVNKADGNTVLTEIEVMGWTKSLQFGQAAGGSGSSQSGQWPAWRFYPHSESSGGRPCGRPLLSQPEATVTL